MSDEEMQRTMEFILSSQAKYEAENGQAIERLTRLERVLKLLIRAGRRERTDLRQKLDALIDAQTQSDDRFQEFLETSEEKFNALVSAQLQMAAGNEARDKALSEMMRAITRTSQRVDAIEDHNGQS